MNWARIALWSLRLFAATQVLSFVIGASAVHWTIYGETMESAFENVRWFRRIALAVTAYVLYVLFLRKPEKLRFANLIGVFLTVEVLNASFDMIMGASLRQVVRWPFTAAHVAMCVAALTTSALLLRSTNAMRVTCETHARDGRR